MNSKQILRDRWEWVFVSLLFLLSFAVLRQQALSRRMSVVVGDLVVLNEQLSGELGGEHLAATRGGVVHERLLAAAQSVRELMLFSELVLFVGAAAYACCSRGTRWVRFALLLWFLYCVVRPVFMPLD